MPLANWRIPIDLLPRLLIVTLIYFLAGRLSLLLAVPPGFAIAIFPPAGIALGAVLIWGPRILPGIALGALLFNLSIHWDNYQTINQSALTLAISVACGAILQAFASRQLILHLIGPRLALDTEKSIYLFFLIGGPLCCLIAASIGTSTLLGLHLLALENFLSNWSTWWIGDTLGVMTITPLVLVLFGQPREIWHARIRSVLLPLSACLLIVTFAFTMIHKREEKKQYNDFAMELDSLSQNLQYSLNSHNDAAKNLASFFASNSNVDRNSFRIFVQNTLQSQHSIAAIAWAPKVSQQERAQFENNAGHEGLKNFQILDSTADGNVKPAAAREVYFPVTYIEPYARTKAALGFDMNSSSLRLYEIEEARDGGYITVTDPIQFWGDPPDTFSVLEYIPVYAQGKSIDSVPERREAFRGVAIVVLRMEKIFDELLSGDTKKSMRFKFYDLSYRGKGGVFYDDIGQTKTQYLYQNKVNFGLRQYALIVQPTAQYWETHISWVTWFSMFNGLLFTGMMGMYLLVISAHTFNVETLVTERTVQLHDSEERLRAVLSNAAEGILTTDASGFIESANESAERLFGLKRGAMFGRNLIDLFQHADAETLLKKYLIDHESSAMQFRQEVTGRKRDGRDIPLELAIAKTKFGNQILLVVIIHDLSERKRVDKLKGEFVSAVSHELRTPLTSIRGSLGLLAEGLGGPLPTKAQTLLNLANDNAIRLTDLINDLLDFEKLEYGGIHFNLQKHSLEALLQSASKANRGYAEKFSVATVFHAVEKKDISVLVDQQRFVQVLSNLLSNAIKFSNKYGQVDVFTTCSGGWVRVAVTDYGIGISEAFQANIFKKFMQEDAQSARKYAGTGLGLSLSKAMIEKMGGRINFHSVEGKGSTFYVELRMVT